MNVKRTCLIVFLALFLILSTSSVYALDNSTDLSSQIQENSTLNGVNDSESFVLGDGNFADYGQWVLDENGNIVYVPSTESHSFGNFSMPDLEDNVTDLRNNNNSDNNYSNDVNQNQNIPPISSPSSRIHMWDEFIKDPEAFLKKYNELPINPSITSGSNNYYDNPCNTRHSKEFTDFINFINENNAKPNVIESKDSSFFYSKNNSYKVRILNLAGNSVGAGVNVTFVFNGKKINAKTDDNGYASFKFNVQPGSYVVNVHSGDIESKNKVVIKSLFKTKNIKKTYKKSSKFTISLIKQKGKPLSKQVVKVTFKGKTYNVKTNSKGVATFKIPKNLKIGKYTIKTAYNSCVAKNKITVVK